MANPNPRRENLKPVRTKEEARKRGAAGGKASAEARRRKKNMQDTFKAILDMPMKPGEFMTAEEIQSLSEFKGKNITVRDAIAIAQVQKALASDTKAAEFALAASGEKPAEKVEVSGNVEVAAAHIRELVAARKAEDGG